MFWITLPMPVSLEPFQCVDGVRRVPRHRMNHPMLLRGKQVLTAVSVAFLLALPAHGSERASGKHVSFDEAYKQLIGLSKTDPRPLFVISSAVHADGIAEQSDGKQTVFRELFGTVATLLGDYDTAERIYGLPREPTSLSTRGPLKPIEAIEHLMPKISRARVLFMNESHGIVRTRGALLQWLPRLKAAGFTHLALEAFDTSATMADASNCSREFRSDPVIESRGYPVLKSGFYTREPVYGAILETALGLGFQIVAYDIDGEDRMRGGATILACILDQNDSNRLVLLGGFGNIAETRGARPRDNWTLADWLFELSAVDPLTLSTTTLLGVSPKRIDGVTKPGVPYMLMDSAGNFVRSSLYDHLVFIAPFPGGQQRSIWNVVSPEREVFEIKRPAGWSPGLAFFSATITDREAGATPSDACVATGDEGCTLFLSPGAYRIDAGHADGSASVFFISVPKVVAD